MEQKLTVLTNVFNEEYLLPFWLEHHRAIFDHGIVIDYRSTDRSMALVREMCPTWEIRTTRNDYFGAIAIDQEFMEIERTFSGYKLVLNTTEFLVSGTALSPLLDPIGKHCYGISCLAPVSMEAATPTTLSELMGGFQKVELQRRHLRVLHSYPDGDYTTGRHTSGHALDPALRGVFILWFGFYPWNDRLIARKLQIRQNMPESDIAVGFGVEHLWNREQLEAQRKVWFADAVDVKSVPLLSEALHG